MKCVYTVVVVLLLAFSVQAEPPTVTIPPETIAKSDYVIIVPETNAKAITYIGMSGVDPVPSELMKDAKMFALQTRGLKDGRYTFIGVATLNDEQKRFQFAVIVGKPPAPPPIPPIPPDPPTPPAPVDPLTKQLADAYALETAPDKRERTRALADVMRTAAIYADDATIPDSAKLAAKVTTERVAKVADSVPLVRGEIGKVMNAKFGTVSFALTTQKRADVKAAYLALAKSLDEVAK